MRISMRFAGLAMVAAMASTACAEPAGQKAQPSQAAAAAETPFTPEVGQEGKDVIWVPTQNSLVDAMLKTAKVEPGELVVDLGSGDGRIPIIAARDFGARARGIEYNPKMVALSRANAEKEGVADKVEFIEGDIFKVDFTDADVLTLYLLPELNLRLREDILKMRPGTRVVSNSFTMGDWEPDETITAEGGTGYFWVVPAPYAAGVWNLPMPSGKPVDLTIEQTYQKVTGSAVRDGKPLKVSDMKLVGRDLTFTLIDGRKTYAVEANIRPDSITGGIKPAGEPGMLFTGNRMR